MKRELDVFLKNCPFCNCSMGVLYLGGGFEWYGRHKSGCALECNPSSSYGHLDDLEKEWNRRNYLKTERKMKC